MAIQDILNKLLSEPLMMNMRQHIVNGLEQVYKDATAKGDTNMEVLRARGSSDSLNGRLDGMQNKQNVTSLELSQKASINYVDAILMDIAKGGPKGLINSLVTLKATYPTGTEGTWLVMDSLFTDGAHSFIWDNTNSTWKDLGVYQSMLVPDESIGTNKLEKNAVTKEKTDFFNYYQSKNRHNPATDVPGYVAPATGLIFQSSAMTTTDFIKADGKYLVTSVISSSGQVVMSMRFVAQYDSEMNVIWRADSDPSVNNTLKTKLDDNTEWVKVTYINQGKGSKIQIEFNGDGIFTPYTDYFPDNYQMPYKYLTEAFSEFKPSVGLKGKKVTWFGSSITQQYLWCQLVDNYFEFVGTNCGVGGTTISNESIASMCNMSRIEGNYSDVVDPITGEVTTTGVAIPLDTEIIFVEVSPNDWARNWTIGDKKISNMDVATFSGACHIMFKNLTTRHPNALIFIVGTPFAKMPNRTSFTNKYGLLNNENLQTIDYGEIALEIGRHWGIDGINMGAVMGVNDTNIFTMQPDGLHLTTVEVQKRAANVIINELLRLQHI